MPMAPAVFCLLFFVVKPSHPNKAAVVMLNRARCQIQIEVTPEFVKGPVNLGAAWLTLPNGWVCEI